MSASICQNFVQNTWKKELCSNCFKSRDEHNLNNTKPSLPVLLLNKKIESIIKTKSKTTKLAVSFINETRIIGYGGEEWPENEDIDDDELDSNYEDSDSEPDDAQYKELQKLTKTNTEFNSINANLLQDSSEVKKSYTHLKLGTPQIDADGRKQTLLVSVTPFGQPEFAKKTSKPSSFIPVAKSNPNKNEEKSLLEEITETLEKGKTPIQIITRKRLVQMDDKSKDATYLLEKAAEQSAEKIKDLKLNKTNIPERKNGLTRAAVIKRDQEKPAIFQTTTAKIELLNTKNIILSKEILNKTEESECDKIEVKPAENNNIVNHNSNVNESTDNDSSEDSGNSLTESLNDAQESREQAGEPDGQADPDPPNVSTEPPALPVTPPPIETRSSFLHGLDKPKLPVKPSTVVIRKPLIETHIPQQTLTTFSIETKISDDPKLTVNGKRKAPRPPLSPDHDLIKPLDFLHQEERASSCSPEPRNMITPEPTPRLSLSISTDSLCDVKNDVKKKERSKGRFSLKKFLRLSSHKDFKNLESPKYEDVKFLDSPTKPRLVIVHPLELNGAKVEVVDKPFLPQDFQPLYIKPPPPPRNIDDSNSRRLKPNLPHPPKSLDVINKQKYLDNNSYNIKRTYDSVYANIGEVRSAIIPNKPQRTASMREREALAAAALQNYEPVDVSPLHNKDKENVYDYISGARSSSPECEGSSSPDKNSPTNNGNKSERILRQARSNSNADISTDYFNKFQNIPRSASLTYCGSETESEIYSPYSFCGSESEIAEDDSDWPPTGRTHKLRSRKGRSIVHKNLEDNYGAVVVANHEALAQVLENIPQVPPIQPALRGLKAAPNLRWTDFSIKENLIPLTVGHRIFHQAIWGAHHVTLVIYTGSTPNTPLSLGTFSLVPITEFIDLVPAKYLPSGGDDNEVMQASISVLPWIQVYTIQSYVDVLKSKSASSTQEDLFKDACFILLQLVNALKMLQAQGIEELPLTLTSFVIYREMDKDNHHRLSVLQGLGEVSAIKDVKMGSLCLCATSVLMQLLPYTKLTPLLRSLLNTERAVSLTQVKSVLEFTLWGPSDVPLSTSIKDRELALQRWLDLQRATVLHGLVCTRIHLTVYEECHLLFLVRSNAKMVCDASLLVDSSYKHSGMK